MSQASRSGRPGLGARSQCCATRGADWRRGGDRRFVAGTGHRLGARKADRPRRCVSQAKRAALLGCWGCSVAVRLGQRRYRGIPAATATLAGRGGADVRAAAGVGGCRHGWSVPASGRARMGAEWMMLALRGRRLLVSRPVASAESRVRSATEVGVRSRRCGCAVSSAGPLGSHQSLGKVPFRPGAGPFPLPPQLRRAGGAFSRAAECRGMSAPWRGHAAEIANGSGRPMVALCLDARADARGALGRLVG